MGSINPLSLLFCEATPSPTLALCRRFWRIGQKVTIMKFEGPGTIILGTGRVLRNIETPPSGGCRTSVELELDNVADCRDTKGFHQLFIYGDLEPGFKAYCQLAGIKVVHI